MFPIAPHFCPKLQFFQISKQTKALQQLSGLELFLLGGGVAND
jgi:hypothetical protein